MKLLIHDLKDERIEELLQGSKDGIIIVSDDGTIKNCIGCFGCWIKTPGACVIRDQYGNMGEILSKCSEVMIISRCFYGGFSPFVKNVLDRSISYLHPYFTKRNGEMHHRSRYYSPFKLKVLFYGDDITEKEKQTAEKLVRANAVNFECSVQGITFAKDTTEIRNFIS